MLCTPKCLFFCFWAVFLVNILHSTFSKDCQKTLFISFLFFTGLFVGLFLVDGNIFLVPSDLYVPITIKSFFLRFFAQCIPVFFSYICIFFSLSFLSCFLVFFNGLTRGFCYAVTLSLFGSSAWVIRFFFFLPGIFSCLISFVLFLKHLYRCKNNHFSDFLIIVALLLFTVLINLLFDFNISNRIINFL